MNYRGIDKDKLDHLLLVLQQHLDDGDFELGRECNPFIQSCEIQLDRATDQILSERALYRMIDLAPTGSYSEFERRLKEYKKDRVKDAGFYWINALMGFSGYGAPL